MTISTSPFSIETACMLTLGLGCWTSDLLSILVQKTQTEVPVSVGVKILDGASVVHFLSTTGITGSVFSPQNLESDAVWDTYVQQHQGVSKGKKGWRDAKKGDRGQNKVPSNWPDFLRDSTNKQELFNFLSNKIALTDCPDGKCFVSKVWNLPMMITTTSVSTVCTKQVVEPVARASCMWKNILMSASSCCMLAAASADHCSVQLQTYGLQELHMHINAICHALGKWVFVNTALCFSTPGECFYSFFPLWNNVQIVTELNIALSGNSSFKFKV